MKTKKSLLTVVTVLLITIMSVMPAWATPSKETPDETPAPTATPIPNAGYSKDRDANSSASDSNAAKSPNTGDYSGWIAAVLAAAGLGTAGVVVCSKKARG